MRQFCVIGKTRGILYAKNSYGQTSYPRKWFDTQAAAEAHAKDLLEYKRPGTKWFVVELRSIVEVEPRPINVRVLQADDIA